MKESRQYFAYGSNMLTERLQSPDRVPGATFLATGAVRGYRLRFHKRSIDKSGKCNIAKTDSFEDVVYGVVFEIPDDQVKKLDVAEGLRSGYHHDDIPVRFTDGTESGALAYVADSNAINNDLLPYEWYHKLVLAGAEQHRLPENYLAALRAVRTCEDPDPSRQAKVDAETALNAYYGKMPATGLAIRPLATSD